MNKFYRYTTLFVMALLYCVTQATAQGPTNSGTDFWFSLPANYEDPTATQQYIRLYIASGTVTDVRIWTGSTLKRIIKTKPNDVVTVDLTKQEAQAVSRSNTSPIPNDQVYRNKAVRVESDAPIVVYAMNRTSFTSDGILVLPVNSIGNKYIIASATDAITGFQGYRLPSQFVVTAPYDGTDVSIILPMNSPNHNAGELFTISMNKGDVFSSMSIDPGGDLSGAYIISNNPISVVAGENCTFLPDSRYRACDHIVEMMPPVSSWGKFYHAVTFQGRVKGDLFRIYAGEPGADIVINGVAYGTLSQAGGANGSGWLEYLPPDPGLYEFKSSKQIFVAQYNNSQEYDNVQTDPFYLMLSPIEQYQYELIFATPSNDFPQNYINLVCDSLTFWGIEIADGGTENWEFLWERFGGGFTEFPSIINGKKYIGKRFEIPPGSYRMRGNGPFAGYIYGSGAYDSYGYPLSVAVGNLELPDEDAPRIEPEQDCDGTVTAKVTDFPDDDQIRSNLSTVRLNLASSFNYNLQVDYFEPSRYRATGYTLTVVDPTQDAKAIVEVSDMAGNISRDTVVYIAFNVTVNPDPLDFGSLLTGENDQQQVTITNNTSRDIQITQAFLQQGNQGFTLVSPVGSFLLAAGQSIQATIRFDATVGGSFIDSLGVTDECGPRLISQVKAQVGKPIIAASDQNWAPQVVSTSVTKVIRVENAGVSGVLRVTGVESGPTNAVYTLPNGLPAFPLILNPGESRQIDVAFMPTAPGPYNDQIVFNHNAPADPANDSISFLMGVGIAPGLSATSYDWMRRRINTGPYNFVLKLENSGSALARVRDLVAGSPSGDVTQFAIDPTDRAKIANVDIPGNGGSEDVRVSFSPTSIGPKVMTIEYNSPSQSQNPVSTLEGIGVQPGLVTQDYNFGTMFIGGAEVSRQVTFQLGGVDPRYIDTVAITSFVFVSDQANSVFDFRYDSPAGGFPIILRPGQTESVTFTGYFQAQAVGARSGSILAITNDGVDTISRWSGIGDLNPASEIDVVTGTFRQLCIPESDTIDVAISNPGTAPLNVSTLELRNNSGDFVLISSLGSPFIIGAGNSEIVRIAYTPSVAGQQNVDLYIESSDPANPALTIPIQGDTRQEEVITTALDLLGSKIILAELGEKLQVTVGMDAPITGKNVTNYRIVLTYDPEDLQAIDDPDSLVFRTKNDPDAVATINIAESTPGRLVIDVSSPNPFESAENLLTVPFWVLFNTNVIREVEGQVIIPTLACTQISSITESIDIDPLCGLNLRLIELFNAKFGLEQNSPNPFNPVSKIQYSIGLDGPARMVLVDMNGKVIQVLVDQFHEPGSYELTVDVSNLPSGVYYYTLVSGEWSETRMMTVLK